ncbi:MAG: hypothetical protein EA411_12230 [Saprospirales bacterium]|nr:MAG: hypothetical protein EA411_12230 [Saprospirales bacterium]
MKNIYLLPNSYHLIGWILVVIFIPLGISHLFWNFEFSFLEVKFPWREGGFLNPPKVENLSNELFALGSLFGLVFISLARLKEEDEFTKMVRLKSWHFSMLLYTACLIVAIVFFYDFGFVYALIFCIYLPFVFFYLRFKLYMIRLNRATAVEQINE